jgi:hypothetical protein
MDFQLNVLTAASNSGELRRQSDAKSQVPGVEPSRKEISESDNTPPKQVEGMSVRESFNFLRERAQFSVDQTSGELEIIPAPKGTELAAGYIAGQAPVAYEESASGGYSEQRLGALLNTSG